MKIVLMIMSGIAFLWGLFFYSRSGQNPREYRPPLATSKGITISDPEHPCGPVSAVVVSRLLNRPLTLAEAKRAVVTDRFGRTSMLELQHGLEKLGFAASGVRFNPETTEVPRVPLILFLRPSHFVAALPKGDEIVLIDPPQAPRVRFFDEVGPDWTGEALIVASDSTALATEMGRLRLDTTVGQKPSP